MTNISCDSAKDHSGDPFASAGFWGAAAFGALLSVVVTGYVFPTSNNLFHLAIVERLYDLPEFAGDAFIQSLRYFSSGLWMILAGSAQWIAPEKAFFALFCLSRLLSFIGFLACADYFGVRDIKQRLLFSGVIAVTPLLQDCSFAGGGGLFINYFTHSEVCNGLFLLAVWAALRGRFTLMLALVGLTFFLNAFFGLWLGFVAACVMGYELLAGRLGLRQMLASAGVGFLAIAACAAPVILNVVSNPDFGKPVAFNFVEFLKSYYPYHFLINTIDFKQIVVLAGVLAICVLSLLWLRDPDRRMTATLAACVLLYGIGVGLPWATHAPAALNLHLLRSGTLIHLLAALLLSVMIVRWWFGPDNRQALAAAAMMVTMAASLLVDMTASRAVADMILLAVVAVKGGAVSPPRKIAARLAPHRRALALGALSLAVLLSAVAVHLKEKAMAAEQAWRSEWARVADWAGRETRPGAIFMPPLMAASDPKSVRQDPAPYFTNTAFETISHRSIWVDWKRGAAVLWRPSYYEIWNTRMAEAGGLKTLAQESSYARAHGISYLIATPATYCEGKSVFSTERLCVVQVD